MTKKRHHLVAISMLVAITMLAACGDGTITDATGSDTTDGVGDTAQPVEPDGGNGSTSLGGVPFFGGNEDQCPSTTLANEDSDQVVMAQGADCFLAEVEASQPVVWDLSHPTVEGDPIFSRYIFDGEVIWILSDDRADTYGNGSITQRRCAGIKASAWEPVGTDCESAEFPGFAGFPEAELGG